MYSFYKELSSFYITSCNPNIDYFKDLFKERIINTIDDFNTKYEFIEESYPFEMANYLKEQNYNEPYIVIRKK